MSKRSKQHRQGKGQQQAPRFELSSITKAQLEDAARHRNAIAARTAKQTAALLHKPTTARKDATGLFVRHVDAVMKRAATTAPNFREGVRRTLENRAIGRAIAKAERRAAKPISDKQLVADAMAIVARTNVAEPLMPEATGFPGIPNDLPLLMGASYSDADNAALRADLWTLLTATLPHATRARCEHTADDGHICGMPAIGKGNHGLNTCATHDQAARLALVMARIQRRPL